MATTLFINQGPHEAKGDPTVGTIGGILLLVVLLVDGFWTLRTWWKNKR